MKKRSRRSLSLLLALVMLLGLLPGPALAAEAAVSEPGAPAVAEQNVETLSPASPTGGTGATEEDPLLVGTYQEFDKAVRDANVKYLRLTNTIGYPGEYILAPNLLLGCEKHIDMDGHNLELGKQGSGDFSGSCFRVPAGMTLEIDGGGCLYYNTHDGSRPEVQRNDGAAVWAEPDSTVMLKDLRMRVLGQAAAIRSEAAVIQLDRVDLDVEYGMGVLAVPTTATLDHQYNVHFIHSEVNSMSNKYGAPEITPDFPRDAESAAVCILDPNMGVKVQQSRFGGMVLLKSESQTKALSPAEGNEVYYLAEKQTDGSYWEYDADNDIWSASARGQSGQFGSILDIRDANYCTQVMLRIEEPVDGQLPSTDVTVTEPADRGIQVEDIQWYQEDVPFDAATRVPLDPARDVFRGGHRYVMEFTLRPTGPAYFFSGVKISYNGFELTDLYTEYHEEDGTLRVFYEKTLDIQEVDVLVPKPIAGQVLSSDLHKSRVPARAGYEVRNVAWYEEDGVTLHQDIPVQEGETVWLKVTVHPTQLDVAGFAPEHELRASFFQGEVPALVESYSHPAEPIVLAQKFCVTAPGTDLRNHIPVAEVTVTEPHPGEWMDLQVWLPEGAPYTANVQWGKDTSLEHGILIPNGAERFDYGGTYWAIVHFKAKEPHFLSQSTHARINGMAGSRYDNYDPETGFFTAYHKFTFPEDEGRLAEMHVTFDEPEAGLNVSERFDHPNNVGYRVVSLNWYEKDGDRLTLLDSNTSFYPGKTYRAFVTFELLDYDHHVDPGTQVYFNQELVEAPLTQVDDYGLPRYQISRDYTLTRDEDLILDLALEGQTPAVGEVMSTEVNESGISCDVSLTWLKGGSYEMDEIPMKPGEQFMAGGTYRAKLVCRFRDPYYGSGQTTATYNGEPCADQSYYDSTRNDYIAYMRFDLPVSGEEGTVTNPKVVSDFASLKAALESDRIEYIRVQDFNHQNGNGYYQPLNAGRDYVAGKPVIVSNPNCPKHLIVDDDLHFQLTDDGASGAECFLLLDGGDLELMGSGSLSVDFPRDTIYPVFLVRNMGHMAIHDIGLQTQYVYGAEPDGVAVELGMEGRATVYSGTIDSQDKRYLDGGFDYLPAIHAGPDGAMLMLEGGTITGIELEGSTLNDALRPGYGYVLEGSETETDMTGLKRTLKTVTVARVIPELSCQVAEPVRGQYPTRTAVVLEGEPYTAVVKGWHDSGPWNPDPNTRMTNQRFEADGTYWAVVDFTPKEGFCFRKGTPEGFINGQHAVVHQAEQGLYRLPFVGKDREYSTVLDVKNVYLNLPDLRAGMDLWGYEGYVTPEPGYEYIYQVDRVHWEPNDGVVQGDTGYELTVTVRPGVGYRFGNGCEFYLNIGRSVPIHPVTVNSLGDRSMELVFRLRPRVAQVERIDLTFGKLVAGMEPSAVKPTIPEDQQKYIKSVECVWSNHYGGDVWELEPGPAYMVEPTITLNPGYELAPDALITVNRQSRDYTANDGRTVAKVAKTNVGGAENKPYISPDGKSIKVYTVEQYMDVALHLDTLPYERMILGADIDLSQLSIDPLFDGMKVTRNFTLDLNGKTLTVGDDTDQEFVTQRVVLIFTKPGLTFTIQGHIGARGDIVQNGNGDFSAVEVIPDPDKPLSTDQAKTCTLVMRWVDYQDGTSGYSGNVPKRKGHAVTAEGASVDLRNCTFERVRGGAYHPGPTIRMWDYKTWAGKLTIRENCHFSDSDTVFETGAPFYRNCPVEIQSMVTFQCKALTSNKIYTIANTVHKDSNLYTMYEKVEDGIHSKVKRNYADNTPLYKVEADACWVEERQVKIRDLAIEGEILGKLIDGQPFPQVRAQTDLGYDVVVDDVDWYVWCGGDDYRLETRPVVEGGRHYLCEVRLHHILNYGFADDVRLTLNGVYTKAYHDAINQSMISFRYPRVQSGFPPLSGDIRYTSNVQCGQNVTIALDGLVGTIPENQLNFEWQVSPDGVNNWQSCDYYGRVYSPKNWDVDKYLRVRITAKYEYPGFMVSEPRLVKKKVCTSEPVTPELLVNETAGTVELLNRAYDQEYVYRFEQEHNANELDWSYNRLEGNTITGLSEGQDVYIYSRVAEDAWEEASFAVAMVHVHVGTQVPLKSVVLEGYNNNDTIYVPLNGQVTLNVLPYPANANQWSWFEFGDPGYGNAFKAWPEGKVEDVMPETITIKGLQPYSSGMYAYYNGGMYYYGSWTIQVYDPKNITMDVVSLPHVDDYLPVEIGEGDSYHLEPWDLEMAPEGASDKYTLEWVVGTAPASGQHHLPTFGGQENEYLKVDKLTGEVTVKKHIPDSVAVGSYLREVGCVLVNKNDPQDRQVYPEMRMSIRTTPRPRIPAESITVEPQTLCLDWGESRSLRAVVTPGNSTDPVVWSVDNTNAFQVSEDGVLTVLSSAGAGEGGVVTATAGDVSASINVYVAQYIIVNRYNLAFEGGEGSTGTPPETLILRPGDTVVLPDSGDLTKDGWVIELWYDAVENRAYMVGDEFTMPSRDVTLTVMWMPVQKLVRLSMELRDYWLNLDPHDVWVDIEEDYAWMKDLSWTQADGSPLDPDYPLLENKPYTIKLTIGLDKRWAVGDLDSIDPMHFKLGDNNPDLVEKVGDDLVLTYTLGEPNHINVTLNNFVAGKEAGQVTLTTDQPNYTAKLVQLQDAATGELLHADDVLEAKEYRVTMKAGYVGNALFLTESSYYVNGSPIEHQTVQNGTFLVECRPGAAVKGEISVLNPNGRYHVELLQGGRQIHSRVYPSDNRHFELEGVAPGVYDLRVSMAGHTDYIIRNVVVTENGLDLTADPRKPYNKIRMKAASLNGDDVVNSADLNLIWTEANYGKQTDQADNKQTDVNGDGVVNSADLNLIWSEENYGKEPADSEYNF